MNILFMHRNFPAQFKFLAKELASNPLNSVYFITNNQTTQPTNNINKIVYKLKREVPKNCHRYLRFYEEAIIHGQAAAEVLIKLKKSGFEPDIIYGHTWGPTLFVKDVFPKVPLICYFEWYYNSIDSDFDFINKNQDVNEKANLRSKNAHILQDLVNCDYGISPTEWQKKQFPKEFQDKIRVIHEGIGTETCKPNNKAELIIKDTNLRLNCNDEVITYATRGMEEYRGFPEFMKTVEKLQKIRPCMQTIIAGEDRVCYGRSLKDDTYKSKMLKELDLDMTRIHFTGPLPYLEYIKLLQISSLHIYLTYPFVLSWSLLEALSCGCLVLASDTEPVKEIIKDNQNGFLTDFSDTKKMTILIDNLLNERYKYQLVREKARESVVDNYDLKNLLHKQIQYINTSLGCRTK